MKIIKSYNQRMLITVFSNENGGSGHTIQIDEVGGYLREFARKQRNYNKRRWINVNADTG